MNNNYGKIIQDFLDSKLLDSNIFSKIFIRYFNQNGHLEEPLHFWCGKNQSSF